MPITVRPLTDDLDFGARITGVTASNLKADAFRDELHAVLVDRGLLVFEDMAPTTELQVGLSNIFGVLQDYAYKGVAHVDEDRFPGLIEMKFEPGEADLFEWQGKRLNNFVPWHFDACYTKELNRGAVLRATVIPPQGGMTGFADGIQLYKAVSPALREAFSDLKILYHPTLLQQFQKFGVNYRVLQSMGGIERLVELNRDAPRSVHPAIWKRNTGEPVLHVSPWQAAGIWRRETPEGDALLESLCQEIYAAMTPYWHRWKATDMLVWDNWRFLHSVSGHDPSHARCVHRTTIKGDYGLGRFEAELDAGVPARA